MCNIGKIRKYKIYGFKYGKKVFLTSFNSSEESLIKVKHIIESGFRENVGFHLTVNETIIQGLKWDAITIKKCFFQPITLLING